MGTEGSWMDPPCKSGRDLVGSRWLPLLPDQQDYVHNQPTHSCPYSQENEVVSNCLQHALKYGYHIDDEGRSFKSTKEAHLFK